MKKISTQGLRHFLHGLFLVVIATVLISCGKSGTKPATPAGASITAGNYMIVNAANPNGCLATGIYTFESNGTFIFAHGTACSAIPDETSTYSITNSVLTVMVSGQTQAYLHGTLANVNASGFDYTDEGSSSFPEGLGTTTHFYSISN